MIKKSTYLEVLKASSIMGGAAGVTMLIGMVRTKIGALLLGTTGVGLIVSLTAIQSLTSTLAGMGLNQSAVRQLADASANGDAKTAGDLACIVRRVSMLTGVFAAFVLAASATIVSEVTFGDISHAQYIAYLSVVVFLVNISGAEQAILQGMRRIGDMAKVNILSALIGLVTASGLYFFIGNDGIVPSLIIAATVQFVFSKRYVDQTGLLVNKLKWRHVLNGLIPMARLGIAFLGASMLNIFLNYATVVFILKSFDTATVGLYSAAFSLSGVLVNFILSAMAADYYPRLISSIRNQPESVRVINEQTQVGVLLSIPGVLATLFFAAPAILLVYSNNFLDAAPVLQVFLIGVFARVIAWPLGYVILARGEGRLFFMIEFLLTVAQLLVIYFALSHYGLPAIAWAFAAAAIANIFIEYYIVRNRLEFKYNPTTKNIIVKSLLALLIAFICVAKLDGFYLYLIGFFLVLIASLWSIRSLSRGLGENTLVKKLISKFSFAKQV